MRIEDIAKKKIVEEIVKKVGRNENPLNLQDLQQDIYYHLLTKDKEKIAKMNTETEAKYYISRIVVNNILSKNSRYYYTYKKDNKLFKPNETEE